LSIIAPHLSESITGTDTVSDTYVQGRFDTMGAKQEAKPTPVVEPEL